MDGDVKKIPLWKNALEKILALYTWGDVIPLEFFYTEFEAEIEPNTPWREAKAKQFQFLANLEALREELLMEYRMALRSVRGVGYEIVKPAAQAGFAIEEGRRLIGKGINKCRSLTINIALDQLSAEERRRVADQEGRIAALEAMARWHLFPRKRIKKDDEDDE